MAAARFLLCVCVCECSVTVVHFVMRVPTAQSFVFADVCPDSEEEDL